MVKKLFKHEFMAQLRLWLPMQIILLAVALFGRIVQFFETDTTPYDIVFGSSVIIYVLALVVSMILTVVFGIVRFYKNLFTHEGYLSFTLPVTTDQHILVKTLVSSCAMVGSLVVAFLSFAFFTAGEVFIEVMKAAGYLVKRFIQEVGNINFSFYLAEGIALLAVCLLGGFLLYYACIALGQTFKKNRVIGAVGVYFIYYAINQFFGTLLVIVINFLSGTSFFDAIVEFIDTCPEGFVHIVLIGLLLFAAVMAGVYYLVIRLVIRNKLNLE